MFVFVCGDSENFPLIVGIGRLSHCLSLFVGIGRRDHCPVVVAMFLSKPCMKGAITLLASLCTF